MNFEAFDVAAPAPPTTGLPWILGGYEGNPLIDDEPTPTPPQPDRHLRDFGELTATPPEQIVTPSYTPGTPWF